MNPDHLSGFDVGAGSAPLLAATGLVCAVVVGVLGLVCAVSVGYLLVLLAAAATSRRRTAHSRSDAMGAYRSTTRVDIVVPAHNEEAVLAATLDSLTRLDWPAGACRIVVVADNCTDATARIARDAGAVVLERSDPDRRGKGYALAWAFERLLADAVGGGGRATAFAIVDADTIVAPQFLQEIVPALLHSDDSSDSAGARMAAVQGRYGVANEAASWRSALMTAAFDLMNHVKPLGRDRIGATVGLKGNGMAFTRTVIEAAPFTGDSITEDIDYGLDLLEKHGVVVRYAPLACVRAQMPTTAEQGASQRRRWESGRYRLLRERAPSLLRTFARRGDWRCLEAALDLLAPPLAELAALTCLWLVLTACGVAWRLLPGTAGGATARALWLAGPCIFLAGFVGYVLGGLALAGARREAYMALLRAPFYAMWKFGLYARSAAPQDWVRTAREPVEPDAGGQPGKERS
jgi:glycosyltransferase involved in cell wall biosynthesis